MAAPGLTYRISVPRPSAHLAQVTLVVPTAGRTAPLEVAMAAWSPGSYLIRDYARFVRDLAAHGVDGQPRPITKLDKATWAIDVGDQPAVTLTYAVYGHELSVRTNHIDDGHAFLHGPATFLYPVDGRALPVAIEVEGPPGRGWALATPLDGGDAAPADRYQLRAASIDALLDAPIHLGHDRGEVFEVGATRFELALWGPSLPGHLTVAQLVADLGAIAADHARRITGDPAAFPFPRYTFLVMLAADGYGGLEHAAGSANLYHPAAFTSRKHYEGLLELLSHELFHAWNGKRIAPAALLDVDYQREAYTRCLWVMEGLTSHYDRYALRSAGRITARSLLEKVLDDWARLLATPGRTRHSLEASSFDAWIKLYRPDESNLNTTVSYYLKGGLVALALDLEIRRRTEDARSLDDVLRLLWTRYGVPGRPHPEDLLPDAAEATGLDLGDSFARMIRGVEDPPLPAELAALGLVLRQGAEPGSDGAPPWLGVTLAGLRVTGVLDGGPAAGAGLAVGDELCAIDRWRVTSEAEARAALAARGAGATVEVALFRRGRLCELPVVLGAGPLPRFEIVSRVDTPPAVAARYQRWLGEPYPPGETLASISVATRAL